MKDPLGDDAPPVETRKAVVGISLMILAIIALVIVRPSTAVTVAIIVGLILTIMLHEFGHYVAAKKSGMKVTEFFLGFGPRIWSFRRGETEYGVKAIPAGGYVRIIGMTNLEEVDPEDEPRTYRQATTGKRLITVLAGIIVNLIIAVVLVFGILVLHGPGATPSTNDRRSCRRARPAAAAGLHAGDRDRRRSTATASTTGTRSARIVQPEPGQAADLHRRARRPRRRAQRDAEADRRRARASASPPTLVGHPMNPLAAVPESFATDRTRRLGHRRRARQGVLRERPRAVRQDA